MRIDPELLQCLVLPSSVGVKFSLIQRVKESQSNVLVLNIFESVLAEKSFGFLQTLLQRHAVQNLQLLDQQLVAYLQFYVLVLILNLLLLYLLDPRLFHFQLL